MSTDYITRETITIDNAKNRLLANGFAIEAKHGHFVVSDGKKDGTFFHFDQAQNGRIWGTRHGMNSTERYVEILNMAEEQMDEDFTELWRGAFI